MQQNLRKMLQKCPKEWKRSPKDTTRARRERQGCHQGAKFTTNGPQREPKGRQRVTKMHPKWSQNEPKMHPTALLEKISKNNDFWTAKMLPKLSKHSLKFIKKNMPRRTSWNLKKHCISAVKTLKSRSRHHQKASKTAAKNESEKEVKKVPQKTCLSKGTGSAVYVEAVRLFSFS